MYCEASVLVVKTDIMLKNEICKKKLIGLYHLHAAGNSAVLVKFNVPGMWLFARCSVKLKLLAVVTHICIFILTDVSRNIFLNVYG